MNGGHGDDRYMFEARDGTGMTITACFAHDARMDVMPENGTIVGGFTFVLTERQKYVRATLGWVSENKLIPISVRIPLS